MQKILAIAWLTWKAAVRFRLFLVITVLLLLAVAGLPLVIKDDGTAQGFTQIIITYTLSSITGLLGISTLWLACGTLARDVEECQIQVVATKPIARWQIWLGKWLGIVTLNAVLLAIAGGCVYGLMLWRSGKLSTQEQAVLRTQVLVARGSAKVEYPMKEINEETDRVLQDRLKKSPVDKVDVAEVRRQIREAVKADFQLVPPSYRKTWNINLGVSQSYLKGKPLQLRVKFNAPQKSASGTFLGMWEIGVAPKVWQNERPMSLAPDAYHEFTIPADAAELVDADGNLTVSFINVNDMALLFPLEDGMEVLYPAGGFAANFARGLGIIFCWMALLAALGLMAASFLSFPVATFFALGLLIVGLSCDTLAESVNNGSVAGADAETGVVGHSVADVVLIPAFKGILTVASLAEKSSPIDALSTGRNITWTELGTAFTQIVLLLGGGISLAGMLFFNRRELAAAQGTQ